MKFKQWEKFESGDWQHEINVRDFIQRNYTPYEGNSDFLKPATEKTKSKCICNCSRSSQISIYQYF